MQVVNSNPAIITECKVGKLLDKSFTYEKRNEVFSNGQVLKVRTGEMVHADRKVWQIIIGSDDDFTFVNAKLSEGLSVESFSGRCRISVESFYTPKGSDTPLMIINGYEQIKASNK